LNFFNGKSHDLLKIPKRNAQVNMASIKNISIPQLSDKTPPNSAETGETSASPQQRQSETSLVFYDKPVTLIDLAKNRTKFAASEKDYLRSIGQKLASIQTQFYNNEIDSDQYKTKCGEIEEAAEILVGVIDFNAEFLETIGLKISEQNFKKLNEGEYKAILDDITIQRSPEHGVVAARELMHKNARIAAGYRAHLDNFIRRRAQQQPE